MSMSTRQRFLPVSLLVAAALASMFDLPRQYALGRVDNPVAMAATLDAAFNSRLRSQLASAVPGSAAHLELSTTLDEGSRDARIVTASPMPGAIVPAGHKIPRPRQAQQETNPRVILGDGYTDGLDPPAGFSTSLPQVLLGQCIARIGSPGDDSSRVYSLHTAHPRGPPTGC